VRASVREFKLKAIVHLVCRVCLPPPSASLPSPAPFFSTAPALLLRPLLRPRPRRPVAVLSARASEQPGRMERLSGHWDEQRRDTLSLIMQYFVMNFYLNSTLLFIGYFFFYYILRYYASSFQSAKLCYPLRLGCSTNVAFAVASVAITIAVIAASCLGPATPPAQLQLPPHPLPLSDSIWCLWFFGPWSVLRFCQRIFVLFRAQVMRAPRRRNREPRAGR